MRCVWRAGARARLLRAELLTNFVSISILSPVVVALLLALQFPAASMTATHLAANGTATHTLLSLAAVRPAPPRVAVTRRALARSAAADPLPVTRGATHAVAVRHGALRAVAVSRAVTRSPSLATVDANARAEGNRRAAAVALGSVLFRRVWPAQILKVRIDGIGRNEVAGLALSGVKFHGRVDPCAFAHEVADLVRLSFAAVPVSEVDVWATTPLDVARGTVVAGDNAQPTARVVFGATIPRAQAAGFLVHLESSVAPKLRVVAGHASAADKAKLDSSLAAEDGIYWNSSWKNALERVTDAAHAAKHAERPDAGKSARQGATRRLAAAKSARVASRRREPRSGEVFV